MNRIKELRKLNRMSQGQLAEMLNVHQMTVSRYENESIELSFQVVNRLCEIFDCTSDYLLGLSDENAKKPAANDSGQEVDFEEFKRLQEVNELFLGLDEAGKAQARAYLRFLSAQQEKQSDSQN